jgi:hypothetical protein
VSALITIAIFVFLGLWASASYARLLRLRRAVRKRWREASRLRRWREELLNSPSRSEELHSERQDADRAFEEARYRYNEVAAVYNKAISMLPARVIAGLAGFKEAELLGPEPNRETHAAVAPPPPADQ